jgi:hypothetical protein
MARAGHETPGMAMRWPDGWDQTRLAAAGVQFFEADREVDVGSTDDAAQPGEEQESPGR